MASPNSWPVSVQVSPPHSHHNISTTSRNHRPMLAIFPHSVSLDPSGAAELLTTSIVRIGSSSHQETGFLASPLPDLCSYLLYFHPRPHPDFRLCFTPTFALPHTAFVINECSVHLHAPAKLMYAQHI